MTDKLIITCAMTGAEVTKEGNPAVPYTVNEMVVSACEAVKAGASVLHIHARRDDGTPVQDAKRFAEILSAIRKECPKVILQVSTGGAVGMSRDERLGP
ncbi:MAG: 3-keto-5-aminohexanoate cleavage protein, partial [Candidatus Izemoplasmatales bacterium]